jgi:hypothetical protein
MEWWAGGGDGEASRREHTKESDMIVLRPAVILKVVAKGTLTDCGAADALLRFGAGLVLWYALRWNGLYVFRKFVDGRR